MSSEETSTIEVQQADPKKIQQIWKVAGILAGVTTLEFIIAFALEAGFMKLSIFVVLTIVKAGYIVGEFMHLKHETKSLMWSILLPMIFVAWMLIAFRYESAAILELRGW